MTDSTPGVAAPAVDLLSLRGIVKRFPGVLALSGVDLDLRRGEIHGLVGENGAGKSTLMKIIAGMEQPDQGTISRDGKKRRFEQVLDSQRAELQHVVDRVTIFRDGKHVRTSDFSRISMDEIIAAKTCPLSRSPPRS